MKLIFAAVSALAALVTASDCHCFPGDDCWPSDSEWAALNETVQGRLVKVVPIGSVCHDPTYDEAACADLRARWDDVSTQ
jgi:hypothetical protein